jgi:multiple sugar transport system ATP-binding protein
MASLEFIGVSKAFGKTVVVEDLSFTVSDGELFVLLGPSGCGKSTILRLIAGLEAPDSGDILIDGKRINQLAPKDRNAAMVFQNYALYPHMTIFDNLAFPLKVKKMPREQIETTVREKAEMLGLTGLLERKPKTLSGGQRQRVALGRALVRNPQVFLFDEPLSNLDAKLRVSTRAEIARLQTDLKATMIYVTHDQEEALSLGNRIAILYEGKLQQVGTPREIYNEPSNVFCAAFVGSPRINLLHAAVMDNNELTLSNDVRLKLKDKGEEKTSIRAGGRVEIGIRPENILFDKRNDGDFELACKIFHCEFAGDRNIIFGKIADQEIRIKSRHKPTLQEGTFARIFINPNDCLLFDSESGARLN